MVGRQWLCNVDEKMSLRGPRPMKTENGPWDLARVMFQMVL